MTIDDGTHYGLKEEKMKNEIILTAEADFHDNELRKEFLKMQEQIKRINERTKNHTFQIKEIEKKLKGVQ